VAAAFASLAADATATAADTTGTLTGFSSGTVLGNSVVFTSTATTGEVSDIAITTTVPLSQVSVSEQNAIVIQGASTDGVRLVGGWTRQEIDSLTPILETIGGETYAVYVSSAYTPLATAGNPNPTAEPLKVYVPYSTSDASKTITPGLLITSGESADVQNGTAGDDEYRGNGGSDQFSAGLGNDSLDAGTGDDTMAGGGGNDTIAAGTGNDVIYGGDATNPSGSGNDVIDGGDGNDSVIAGDGDDQVLGGAGSDTVLAGSGHDSVDGGDGTDVLSGDEGNDTLIGGAGDDTLSGGIGNDSLDAGIGNDAISADAGNGPCGGHHTRQRHQYRAHHRHLQRHAGRRDPELGWHHLHRT
jgi:Ca2+-binding RTX toxin-like protein